jgi:hypothetical protein
VIVVRDLDGRIHVLDNRCAHRGPHLCGQESGHTSVSCALTTRGPSGSTAVSWDCRWLKSTALISTRPRTR